MIRLDRVSIKCKRRITVKRIIAVFIIGVVLGILANGIQSYDCRDCSAEYKEKFGDYKGIDVYVFGQVYKIIRWEQKAK